MAMANESSVWPRAISELQECAERTACKLHKAATTSFSHGLRARPTVYYAALIAAYYCAIEEILIHGNIGEVH